VLNAVIDVLLDGWLLAWCMFMKCGEEALEKLMRKDL